MAQHQDEASFEHVVPAVGDLRHEWCRNCAKSTLATVTISAITSEGARVMGGYAICESCGWSPYPELMAGLHGRA